MKNFLRCWIYAYILTLFCFPTSAQAQITEYIQNFNGTVLPTEWSSSNSIFSTALVSDTDPTTGEIVNALQLSVDKVNNRFTSYNVNFPSILDLSNNAFFTIRIRNPDGVAGFEIRLRDANNVTISAIFGVVLSEGYNDLYFLPTSTNIDYSQISRMEIRPTTATEYATYQGDIYIDFIKIGNNTILPTEKADLLNLFARDGFNVTDFTIDNSARTVSLDYAGPDDASRVRLYTATSNAASWSVNSPLSYRNYDVGFTADLTSLQGTIINTYSFSATRIDPNLRLVLPIVRNEFDNATLSNIELGPLGDNIMQKVANLTGGTLSGGVVTTPDGVAIRIASSEHANVGIDGIISYPTGDPVLGSITFELEENGYTEQFQVNVNILPELLTTIQLPTLFTGIANRSVVLPVDSLLQDNNLFSNNLSFSFTVNDTTIVNNLVQNYQAGDKSLLLSFNVFESGAAIVDVNISDGGTLLRSVKIGLVVQSPVTPLNRGVQYSAKDVRHWQPRPYKTNAVDQSGFPIILEESSYSKSTLEFYHGIMSGILLPPISGNYQFSISGDGEGEHALWLIEGIDPSLLPNEADPMVPTNNLAGLESNGSIVLQAGTPYYFEGHHRQIVNDATINIKWKRPGDIDFTAIPQSNIVQFIDFELPQIVTGISSVVGENAALLRWQPSTDDQSLEGYQVYLNGAPITNTIITDTEVFLEGLTGETDYEVVVVSVDAFGHYGLPSNIYRFTTTPATSLPAALPSTFDTTLVAAFKAEFSWSTSSDALGYNIYLDGVKLNENLITDTDYKIEGLLPETAYTVELRTLNGSFIESTNAATINLVTYPFDINNPNEEVLTAEISVTLNTVAIATGLAMNIDEHPGAVAKSNPAALESLMNDFKAAGLRLGAIPANTLNYSTLTGAGSSYFTIADFVHYSLTTGGKYVMICTGPGPNTDYFTATASTFGKLMEYLSGDASTPEGARRAAEGYNAPFTNQLEKIIIELGNEVWGGEAHGVPNFNGNNFKDVYLQWVRTAKNAIISSPYYDPNKFLISVNARSPQFPSFQDQIYETLKDDPFPYILSLSGYVGGNLLDSGEDFSDLAGESRIAYHKQSFDRMAYYLSNMDNINRKAVEVTGRIWPFFPYESNSTQSNYHGSLGQAVLTVDYLHEYVKKGAVLPAIFSFSGGQWRVVTENPDGTFTKRPLFHLAALSNEVTRGGVLFESTTSSAQTLTNHFDQPFEFAPVGFHAFNRGNEYVMQFFSREFEDDYVVKVSLPDVGPISNTKMTVLSGTNYDTEEVTFSETTNIEVEDGMLVTVPKYSMVVITFNADDLGLTAPLLNDDFEQVTDVSIGIKEGSQILDDQKAFLTVETSVFPSDAFVSATDIVILDPEITGASLQGNLLYPGNTNGTIQIFARSKSDSTVISDTLTINIDKSTFVSEPVVALKVTTPPTLTGALDASWDLAVAQPLPKVVIGQVSPTNLAASFRTLWDDNFLYVHVEVTDDFVRTDANATFPFDWDGIEVFIDATNTKNDSYIQGNDAQYASAYAHNVEQLFKTFHASKEGVLLGDTLTNKGYNKVIAFPLSTINIPTDSLPEYTIGFEVQVNDNDAGSGRENKITWNADQDVAWFNPSVFGELVLDEFRSLTGIGLQGANSITMNADEEYRALLDFIPSNATFKNVTWMSSNPSVATVSTSGLITAIDEGTATITATSEEGVYTTSLVVTVNKPVTGIQVTPTEDVLLPVGDTYQLSATVLPTNAFLQGITWSTSDSLIATVDASGLVTGIAEGEVVITATTEHRSFNQSVNFTVNIPVSSIAFQLSSLSIEAGNNVNLTPFVTFSPADATLKELLWSVSDPTRATIDANGILSVLSNESFQVTATSVDGGFSDQLEINNANGGGDTGAGTDLPTGRIFREYWRGISGINLSYLTNNANYPDNPTGYDYLVSFQAVNWNNPSVKSNWDDNYGQRIRGYVHPETTGDYVFFISGDDHNELYLSTDEDPLNKTRIAYVTGWTRLLEWDRYPSQRSAVITLEAGKKYYIEALHKEGAGGDNLSVGWSLLPDGNPLPSTPDRIIPGSVLSEYFDDSQISEVQIALTMDIGQTLQLDAIITPLTAINQAVTWSSSDSAVVAVDQNGLATAIGSGVATITVTTNDGGLTDELEVFITVSNQRFAGGALDNGVIRPIDFNVYPNPVSKELFVDIPVIDGDITIKLLDLKGVIIENLTLTSEIKQASFGVDKLNSGLYILSIITDRYSINKKILVKN